jgi:purine-binding chemotaxis protein CheW
MNTPELTHTSEQGGENVLVLKDGNIFLCIPARHTIEIMRPLPIRQLLNPPHCILGISIIRGKPTPVLDIFKLLNTESGNKPTRFVLIKSGEKELALAVAQVLYTTSIPLTVLNELPSVFREGNDTMIKSLAVADEQLGAMLDASKLMTKELLERMEGSP